MCSNRTWVEGDVSNYSSAAHDYGLCLCGICYFSASLKKQGGRKMDNLPINLFSLLKITTHSLINFIIYPLNSNKKSKGLYRSSVL